MSKSMFRSPQDDSSSEESGSISSEEEQENGHTPRQDGNSSSAQDIEPTSSSLDTESTAGEILGGGGGGGSFYGDLGFRDIPDVDAEGHAALMTAALLEHYCLTKACGILNEQSSSRGQYTLESPEVKLLGRRLYTYQSKFLSSHGIVAPGVDNDSWESTRQYYREGLDTIGMAALDGLNLNARAVQTPIDTPQTPLMALGTKEDDAVAGENRMFSMKQPTNISLQRLITGRADVSQSQNQFTSGLLNRLQRQATPLARSISIPFLYSHPSGVGGSRYATEFEEEALIGRGSYGMVYRVRHHVDGQDYAVKKIPLSSKKLQQLQERGLREVDNILKEIRTLAKLEHVNVVRYYGAWAEYSPTPVTSRSSSPPKRQQTLLNTPYAEYDGSASSCGIVFEESDHGVVFEEPSKPSPAHEEEHEPSMDRLSTGEQDRRRGSFATVSSERSLKSFVASVEEGETDTIDDEHVESIPRQLNFTYSGQTSASESGPDIFSDGLGGGGSNMQLDRKSRPDTAAPVTLHIQMSLHPLSLAKYLVPQVDSGSPSVPRHCYHIIPSIKLLLGILSGVDYLHAKGIVHRDLKPANVFLSPSDTEQDTHLCPICRHDGHDQKIHYSVPRIGDFGLVAESPTYGKSTIPEDLPSMPARPVGTEFYRPPAHSFRAQSSGDLHPYADNSLDIYALGVILFELLYKIDTRMERQMVLSNLTCSPSNLPQFGESVPDKKECSCPALPADFTDKIVRNCINHGRSKNDMEHDHSLSAMAKDIAKRLAMCIMGMVELDIRHRSTCKKVREELEEIRDLAESLWKGS
ncbi:protein kinase, putative [Trichophyton verrucosum HKI 0517]|uniref:Protein kinase, putative n=1 Tax=Trichophyton verrucosum (strain HKI 0517) TaxID=663202 RepID=D4D5V9_TRIVH|nr:protein kinase, putative [Trichophyton verrucosum HKI 0517]EFE42762.1 protein kinase, putative [Trichophyton verrucosum HKI 0517]